jgi:hypothetical protein
MVEWFYGKEGQQYGPIDEATLRARIVTGEVGPRDLIWSEGMSSWQPLQELPQFAAAPQVTVDPATGMPREGGVPPELMSQSPYAPPAVGLEGASYRPGPSLPVTNGLAIASMVCGILSLVFFCLCGGVFLGIPGVICGHLSLSQLQNPENSQAGKSMAIAGLICGYIGIIIFVVMMLTSGISGSGGPVYLDFDETESQ